MKKIVQVGTYFPFAQLCSVYGTKNVAVKELTILQWTCKSCHTYHNRDENAAMKLLKEGLSLQTIGTTGLA